MKRMTRNILTRLLLLALCAVTVLSLFSCTSRKERPDGEGESEQRLMVESVSTVYSEQILEDASTRIASLFGRLLRLGGGPVLDVTQKQKLESRVREEILPRLEQTNIYEEELRELLRVAEEITDAAERGELEDSSDLVLLFRFYQSGLATVDTQKMGCTLYCILESWLEYQRDYNRGRYDRYGYKWYLEDASRYEAHLTALHEQIGVDTFSHMTSMLMFGISMVGGLAPDEAAGGAFSLTNAEMVMLIRRQAGFFADKQITEAQWTSITAILSEWLKTDTKTVVGAQIEELRKVGYLEGLASLMPSLLELYRAMANGLTEDMMMEWSSATRPRASIVSALLLQGKEVFFEFDRRWSTLGKSESDGALASIQKMGLEEEYATFLEKTPAVCADALIEMAATCASADDIASAAVFYDALWGYLRTYLPCMAFALSQTNE